MNMRDWWKDGYRAARSLRACGYHDFMSDDPDMMRALDTALRTVDPLARHFPGRILRILAGKRDRVANPWRYQSFNCRCVVTPITAQ